MSHRAHARAAVAGDTDVLRSPPLALLAVVATVLSVAGALVQPLRAASFFEFGAAITTGLFAATVTSRLLFHRINVAGVHIALFGGIAAAIFLGISGLSTWALAELGSSTEGAGALQALGRATGLFGHAATVGLLLAGVSIPSLVFGLMPRWACWFGILVALLAEISTLGLLVPALGGLASVARYLALVWLIVAGFTIPSARAAAVARLPESARRLGPESLSESRSPRSREAFRRGRGRPRRYRRPATETRSRPSDARPRPSDTRHRPPETRHHPPETTP